MGGRSLPCTHAGTLGRCRALTIGWDMTDAVQRRLAKLEAKAEPDQLDLEMLGRLYMATGSDKAQPIFAQLAVVTEERADPRILGAHLYVGCLWRLAGDDARARRRFLMSRDALKPVAGANNHRMPKYLFTLLLLGDDDQLVAEGVEFGAEACGEIGWAVVETVRAHRDGDEPELERLLADWDLRADSEPVDMDGRHPSYRDLRDLLRAKCGAAPAPAAPSPAIEVAMAVSADDVAEGDVLGWWGHYVVLARDEIVTLYDTNARGVAYRVTATTTDVLSWDPETVQFAARNAAYVLAYQASGLVATMLRTGEHCSINGHLLSFERGFDASVYRADGVALGAGRSPAALAPAGNAFAMAADNGMFRITRLDADFAAYETVDVDLQCSTVAWSPDGTRIVCGAEASQTVHTVDALSGFVLDSAALHYDDPIVGVAASPSATTVASVGWDGVLGMRRLDPPMSLSHNLGERLEDLAWDATGELIAVLGDYGWFVVTAQGNRLDIESASSMAWHPNERKLALGRNGHLIVLNY